MKIATTIGCATALVSVLAGTSNAQNPSASVGFLEVGSERERILRILQVTGDVPLYPWSTRPLSPREQDLLEPTTRRGRALLPRQPTARSFGRLHLAALPVQLNTIYNSAFPFGNNDGPIWAGRGLTAAVSGGFAGRTGPLSFQLQPIYFEAQNASFPLRPNGDPANPLGDPFAPYEIDQPQRFGNSAYGRYDWGESNVRLDAGPVFAELSSASQWWGPAIDNPLILGDNAGGFPHVALGSATPWNVGLGTVHGRVVYGRLNESAYSPKVNDGAVRFMSGVVGSFRPRGLPGLEVGAARFFHSPWPSGGLSRAPWSQPFEGLLKQSLESSSNPTGDNSDDNQLASVFMRAVLPVAAVELYAEYGREDHNVDARDLWQEPDHDAAYTIGFQRAWLRAANTIAIFRGEVVNARVSALEQGRAQTRWYQHSSLTQGHTLAGQVLGSPAAFGGGGAELGCDLVQAKRRWTIQWNRTMRGEFLTDLSEPLRADVQHSGTIEYADQHHRIGLTSALSGVWELNRVANRTLFNLNLRLGAQSQW